MEIKYSVRLFLTVLLVLSFIIPLIPTTVGAANIQDNETIVVSMGDSFSSGEGVEQFYYQNLKPAEKVKKADWLAHRSEQSWPGRLKVPSLNGTLADYKDTQWFFVASSGAVTADIMGTPDKSGVIKGQEKKYNIVDGNETKVNLPPQIDVFNQINANEVDYVTLTLGGNDAKFSEIIETAAKNSIPFLETGNLSTLLSETMDDVDTILNKLKNVYTEIAKAAPNAKIIVAGYPKLLDKCIILFDEQDVTSINSSVVFFNDEICKLVNECSEKEKMSIYFASVIEEFEGHESYATTKTDYLNGIYPWTKGEDLMKGEFSAYSMHPNIHGVKAYARCVQAKIDELEGVSNVTCSPDIDVSVLDYGGNLCDDYDIIIDGKSNGAFWGLIKNDYHKKIRVNEAKIKTIHLPEGKYDITVTDGDIEYTKTITIKKKAIQNALRFYTDFNYQSYGDLEDDSPGDNTQGAVTSGERDIVLVLDNSGSMSGTPIQETKKASEKFIETILKEDASIGIVKYDSSAEMISNFSMNETQLKGALNQLYASGGTDILSGLTLANEMLQQSNAKKQIIVLMSDGLPSNSHEELIEYAEELREKGIIIYTLGFFGDVGYEKPSAQSLMEVMASEGCHYEVSDADSLVYFFGDVADQINGQKYIYIRIACPVDVTIKYKGETLCSDVDDLSTRTSFGSLTFEENTKNSDSNSTKDDRVKILRLKEGPEYDIQIKGTGRGRMNYTIGFMDENGKYSDLRKFYNIKITNRTVIDTVASNTSATILNVDEDGDGKYDLQYKAKANSRGEVVETNYIWFIVGGVSLIAIIAISIVVIKKKKLFNKKGL